MGVFMKKTLLIISFIFLLTGCNKDNPANTNENTASTITDSLTEGSEGIISPEPTKFANNSTKPENEDTALVSKDKARALIMERLDITKYELTILEDSIHLNNSTYYGFLVIENNVTYSPALIVDKQTGEVLCYATDGSVSPFANFPLYIADISADANWNGTFTRYNNAGIATGTIELAQNDAHSFLFILTEIDGFNKYELDGIAEFDGNTATYSFSDGAILHFVLTDAALSILSSSDSLENISSYTGIYYLYGADVPPTTIISEESAIKLLSTLTMKETKLPAEIKEYSLIPYRMTITIKGQLCYSIGAYVDLTERKMLMNTYYVAVDGSKIFMFDYDTADDIVIYTADE